MTSSLWLRNSGGFYDFLSLLNQIQLIIFLSPVIFSGFTLPLRALFCSSKTNFILPYVSFCNSFSVSRWDNAYLRCAGLISTIYILFTSHVLFLYNKTRVWWLWCRGYFSSHQCPAIACKYTPSHANSLRLSSFKCSGYLSMLRRFSWDIQGVRKVMHQTDTTHGGGEQFEIGNPCPKSNRYAPVFNLIITYVWQRCACKTMGCDFWSCLFLASLWSVFVRSSETRCWLSKSGICGSNLAIFFFLHLLFL